MREEAVDELLSFIVDQIGRNLSSIERRILERWVEQETDPDMIRIAVEDNLFRKPPTKKSILKSLKENQAVVDKVKAAPAPSKEKEAVR